MPHISLAAETIGVLWKLPITNSLAATWLVMAILFSISIAVSSRLTLVPGRFQSIIELVVGGFYDFFKTINGASVRKFFPLLCSIFLFILFSNWIGLLPGFGTIGYYRSHQNTVGVSQSNSLPKASDKEFLPFFRGPTADLNTTIALALVAVAAIQYFGFKTIGGHYSTRFINLKNPILFFIGILEIISEMSKVISFAFRLFGNIFAGEVLLTVMAFLMPFIVPLPFLMLELFVGFIQALVFSMLTAVFLNVAVSHGEASHGSNDEQPKGVSIHG